jgi:O-succinylbenzoic acid--CoA ligase
MTNKESADLFCKEWLEGKSAFTIQTSGSTGVPKTIEFRREQMIASARKTIKALDLREGMTSLVCLNVNFIAGRMMLVRSLEAGMRMIIAEPAADPLENLRGQHIDFAAMVPYQLECCLNRSDSVNKIILGGAPISASLAHKIQALKNECYATFGMTETITHIALQKLNGKDKQDYFETLEGIDITVDNRGCLVIKTDYLDEDVVTNDVVELIDYYRFRWLGRFDNVINSGGIKVIPEKVERIVAEYLTSNQFFVGALDHEQLGQQVVLVIEGTLNSEEEDDLMKRLREKLSRYEIPKQVLYSDRFVATSTQKINRKLSIENALPRPSSLR